MLVIKQRCLYSNERLKLKHNNKMSLLQTSADGIHFIDGDSIIETANILDSCKPSNKLIIYEQQRAAESNKFSTFSQSYQILKQLTIKFPNLVISLNDEEIALFYKKLLLGDGKKVKVATSIHNSINGDYIFYPTIGFKFQDHDKVHALLNKGKCIILTDNFMNNSDNIDLSSYTDDNLIVSTYNPARTKRRNIK